MIDYNIRIKTEDDSNKPIIEIAYTNPNPQTGISQNLLIQEGILEAFADLATEEGNTVVVTKTTNGNQFKIEVSVTEPAP